MPEPTKSHDLRLPGWGPYSKRYAGISHIPDVNQGLRFDLSVIPGHYRRQMLIPNEKWASGHHAWEAAPDLSYYAYRYEIEWKDQVYCDVSFSAVSERARLVRCAFVNQTESPQNLMLHLIAYMNFPPVRVYSDEAIRMLEVTLPENGVWIDALDYHDLGYATPRPTDNLVEDGWMRAEIRDHGFVNGSGIGTGFGREPGDWVLFRFPYSTRLDETVITMRYRLVDKKPAQIRLEGLVNADLTLGGEQCDDFGFTRVTVPVGQIEADDYMLRMISLSSAGFELDGFAITAADYAPLIQFNEHQWAPVPEIRLGTDSAGPVLSNIAPGDVVPDVYINKLALPNSLTLRYADVPDVVYGLAWDHPDACVRQILHHELDSFLRHIVPDNYTDIHQGSGAGHFADVFIRPVFLAPQSEHVLHTFVCCGSAEQVADDLNSFIAQSAMAHEATYASARAKTFIMDCLPAGDDYRFSQERMAATELINVVYPVYTQRQYIRHYTPGKWWDCLYTWDSGFIGLGLLELDLQRAIDNLNAYLTTPGNSHAAFIHHGSPVPVQMYLYHEMWNRTQDRDLLAKFYPGLRQYYLFLAGRSDSSTTRALKSNLLRTWEYFFWDSGGWDDYPAQVFTQAKGIAERTTCAAITAHVIRSARILLSAAEVLGISDDQALYREDIELLSDALQRFAWDGDTGYFSYVLHDQDGRPQEHLWHTSSVNFNMGLDGVMPLVAGVCTPEQEELFLNRLQDQTRFWTPIGLSAVDLSAPYYRKDGYWNGSVWMPHQWFIWKTALDLGQGDFAYQIAKTALDLWKAEVEASYYCFEHFIIETGRGAGWHQFGGLSSPVLSWFNAYHRPGRLTTGLNVWIEDQQFFDDNQSFKARIRLTAKPRTTSVVVNMQFGHDYAIQWNGEHIPHKEINPGSLQIDLPFVSSVGELQINIDAAAG